MIKQSLCKIINKEALLPEVYKFTIEAHGISKAAEVGQFLEIRCSGGIDPILRRPISISYIDRQKEEVEFIIQVKGKGTQALSGKNVGDYLDIIGPLGKGFTISNEYIKVAIIGGGIGCFPLLLLASELRDTDLSVYLGYRSKENVVLENNFNAFTNKLKIATDDGSYGYHSLVTGLLEQDLKDSGFDMIYACGPLPMLKKVKEIAVVAGVPCEISVEQRMACGVGACLGCAIKVADGDDWKFGHVCKDGPVFSAKSLILE